MILKDIDYYTKSALIHERRAKVIASNLSNANTPNYKAKDIDFRQAINEAQQVSIQDLTRTDTNHLSDPSVRSAMELKYRVNTQPSLDNNTVDSQLEKTAWSENSLRFMASMTFLESEFQKLKTVIKGGN